MIGDQRGRQTVEGLDATNARHRLAAAQQTRLVMFPCDVRSGSFDDALWYALGANREQRRHPGR